MTTTWTAEAVAAALADPGLPTTLDRLGFRPDDRDDAVLALRGLGPEDHALVAGAAGRLGDLLGRVPGTTEHAQAPAAFDGLDDRPGRSMGLLPLAALVLTADGVRAWHAGRGIDAETSDRALTDLGQQVWVHRQTFGAFGIHTQGWLAYAAWTGVLFWFGRLQFNLQQAGDGHWRLSTHIPQSGPLTPEAVDDAFAQARPFFAAHFADHPATEFFCHSWLLDPRLVEVLAPTANIALFQQRWEHVHAEGDGNGDALFFVFRRRFDGDAPIGDDPRLAELPRDTSLQRAILDHLAGGGHWGVCSGDIPFDAPVAR